ncbi:MAG: ABC transporter ATP-binding protein [Elusimicrobia bacterium RIFOXYD2_FULL_34_15]|nr:MAG: ABC transporter ATP-binding protein [Elusimicrobia bacterium RIFOXYD2_FULL_34_15]
MIQILNIKKTFGDQLLYDNITFNINSKEKIGLVGRNGHGKTTLFHMILGNIQPDEGTISIPKGYRIGYLEQHINFTQDTVLQEGCLGLSEDDKYDTWKVEKILSGLGFSKEDMQKPCSIFSGGYQIRLNLAKVLVSEPEMLLLDEPNNYLDIVASRWLISFLKSWQGELMLITHDRAFMDSVTTHTIAIHRAKIRKVKGNTEKLYNQLAVEEEVYEKTRLNEETKRAQLELFIARFKAKSTMASQAQSKIKLLEKMTEKKQLEKIETLDFSFKSIPFHATQMMNTSGITFSYTGQEPYLINDISVNIGKKERIFVIGKNGKGKSTFLKILANELTPLSGNIKTHPSLTIGYFGQPNMLRLNSGNTVLDEIMSASPSCSLQIARNIAGTLMFKEDNALKKISVISGGEKSRVLLAKILVTPCQLLMLDEPTNHLDMDSCEALMEAIDEFGGSVIMVTHDEMFLKRLAKRLIIFDKDKVRLYEGGYQDFLDNVGWKDEYNSDEEKPRLFLNKPSDNKKELEKLKKEKIKERDNILKPLSKEINEIEKTILTLENELKINNDILVKASMESDIKQITDTSKRNSHLKHEIKLLFDKLVKISSEYETRQKEFENNITNPESSVN